MQNNFSSWNETAVAHMFVRIITKKNHPYNKTPLTLDEFNNDYNTMKEFIKWHKDNPKIYFLYNFTQDNMNELIDQISYETNNEIYLRELWLKICNI
jgi:hypothetical protein